MNNDTYYCDNCGDDWVFAPEDYDFYEPSYPTTCPFCEMPITQMWRDVYKEEGLNGAIKQTLKRWRLKT